MNRINHRTVQPIFFLFITILLISVVSENSFGQQPGIFYTLGMSKPSTHLFEVEIRLESVQQEQSLDLLLPVWRPGRYMISDFASGVQDFAAYDGDEKPLKWEKTEKSRWHIESHGVPTVHVRYKVYSNEFNQRTRGLNDEHGFVDETAVFMYVQTYRNLPLTLVVQPYKGWHVTTGLDGRENRFTAPSYDYFVDCPLEIGTQKDFSFNVGGIPHVLSIAGEGNWNADTLIRDITKIVQIQKEFWGEFPYKKYIFLVHCMANPTGATEHLNSTILQTTPFAFKNPDRYRGFLTMVSHEYFHTWNVKQLRPAGINPYDFMKENYSRELWIAEGTTSYYEGIMMVRAGLTKAEKLLEDIGEFVQNDRQRPGNLVEPVSEASFDVWVKDSRGTEQRQNAESGFYEKGACVSALLDLRIRKLTANKFSLDDVMRTMYKRFPLPGKGYTLKDFQSVAEEFTHSSLQSFFDDFIYGTKPLPWEESLGIAGIELTPKDSIKKPWLGISTYDAGDRMRVWNVVAGSPAENAGISVGDELLALNGYRTRSADFSDRISEMKEGGDVVIALFRNDKLREVHGKVGSVPVPAYSASKVKNPSPEQKSIYESWLKTTW
jgi:predicted metalloprotease with PDZ domain